MTSTRTSGVPLPGPGWVKPWFQAAEIAWSAPVVIACRAVRMASGGWPPSARDRREYTRMVQEKVQAFSQAATAAVTTPPKDTAKAVGAVLGPVHRRVVANRRRLSRG
jgi:hypothetical protein